MSAFLAIAYRDLLKFLRDPLRIAGTLIFPIIFIVLLGGTLEAGFGGEQKANYNLLYFVYTGVLAQTVFQSSALGIISLIEDRENDFSQEVFVSPISRYTIVIGKILGETLVSLVQGVAILAIAPLIGVPLSLGQVALLVPVLALVCLMAGAFGVVVLANIGSQRAAQQVFPFIFLPQFFLAGVFIPLGNDLPLFLKVLSLASPMRYAVDLARNVYYAGNPEYADVVLRSPQFNLTVIFLLFAVFLVVGTTLFVRKESNR